MDKWSDDQLKKMELGGNIKAKDFFEASPDYFQGMSIKEKYSSVFATQYKEKVILHRENRAMRRGWAKMNVRRHVMLPVLAFVYLLATFLPLTNNTLVPHAPVSFFTRK